MIVVVTKQMNRKNIVKVKKELVSVIYSLVIMAIAFHVFIFVMVTTIVLITLMKMYVTNVIPGNVILTENSLAWLIAIGDEHSVYLKDGFVMVIQIVLMELTKIPLYIRVLLLNHVNQNNSSVQIVDVSIKNGFVVCLIACYKY